MDHYHEAWPMSPTLFNLLIEKLVNLPFRNNTTLLSYADDLQLITTGPHQLLHAQHALDLITQACTSLGLKINPSKSSGLNIGPSRPFHLLTIQGQNIDWVEKAKCLGHFFSERNHEKDQLDYLKQRIQSRILAMRKLTSTRIGAGYKILRTFYTQAIRSIIDFSALSLLTLSSDLLIKLEKIQNEAMRIILGAPRWTRLENLRIETNLCSLRLRTLQITSSYMAKSLSSTKPLPFKQRIQTLLTRPIDTILSTGWHFQVVLAIKASGISHQLVHRTPTQRHPLFKAEPPWNPLILRTNILRLPKKKVNCSQEILNKIAIQVNSKAAKDQLAIFTDGSVNQISGHSGASIHCTFQTSSWRLSDYCSTLQTELFAIDKALTLAISTNHKEINIYTDSLSAIQALYKSPDENIMLMTTLLYKIQVLHKKGSQVILNWIPSHIGIIGNEIADRAASEATLFQYINFHIPPSSSQIKKTIRQNFQREIINQHLACVNKGSYSASWYKTVTNYQRVNITNTMPREQVVIIHRLRLGYKCNWEIAERVLRECTYCQQETTEPLLHYLLSYDIALATSSAQEFAKRLLENTPQDLFIFPPPR
nr:uncharacterized protein LOC113815374 [Penaeus vannamei]